MDNEKKCVFCDIIAGETPAQVVDETPLSLAILDVNPWSKGHTLVIPKRHVPWWHQLTEEETADLFTTARRIANKISAAFCPEFVFLYARGKRIPHTHIFLIPSYNGDILDRVFNALELIQETPQDMAELKTNQSLENTASLLRAVKSRQ